MNKKCNAKALKELLESKDRMGVEKIELLWNFKNEGINLNRKLKKESDIEKTFFRKILHWNYFLILKENSLKN